MSEFTVGISDDNANSPMLDDAEFGPATEIDSIVEGLPETPEGISITGASEATDSIKFYPRTQIRQDLKRNPRKATRYTAKELSPLVRSIYKHGIQEPPTVSERANGEPWVVKGHRRLAALNMLITEGLPKDAFGPAIDPQPGFMPKVRCRVLRGLSIQGEIDILMDHGDVVRLDKQEKLLAARIMVGYGLSHDFIAGKLGGSRSNYSNGLAKVLSLPQIVEDTYLSTEDNAPNVTQPILTVLKAAYDKDRAAKLCGVKEEGPTFKTEWENFIANGTTRLKVLSRKIILSVAEVQTDPDVRNILAAIADNDKDSLGLHLENLNGRLTDLSTVNTGFTRIEEGIATTVKDFVPAES